MVGGRGKNVINKSFVDGSKEGIDEDGKIIAWAQHSVTQSVGKGTPFEKFMVKDGVDRLSVEGIVDTPYQLPTYF